jgi:nucleotide-binding universal stress UspA family protein
MRFHHVLVAIDGSEYAAHALDVASSLATAMGAHLGLVHVIDPKFAGSETGVPADKLWAILRADGKGLLDAAAATVSPAHPECWRFLREGTPWSEIVDSARKWPADLIVIGTHGRSGITRLVFGSTAEGVTRHAPCPVVVVPPVSRTHERG